MQQSWLTRCKDCLYFNANNRDAITGEVCGECPYSTMLMRGSNFCAYGMTKDERVSNGTKLAEMEDENGQAN